jgi:nucleotide sugar dehydrogenase
MLNMSDDQSDNAVCVVGLGYVGLTLAVGLAGIGFHVDGVELRAEVVEELRRGRAHFYEPGLNDRLKRLMASGHITASQTIPSDTRATVYVVTVGTPLGADREVRTDMIIASCRAIARQMKAGDMVILRSTVQLGTTRSVVMPILDTAGVPYDIAFCPERTVEGQALAELRTLPQVIGAGSTGASVRAGRLFNALTPTIVRVPSIEVAEMIKLVDNTYRDITFAFANEVARMCDGVGVSAHDVIIAGKLGYPRTSVPLPGLVGGPCLDKDTHILAQSVRSAGITPDIALTARLLNERQPGDIARRLCRFVESSIANWPQVPQIAVLGLAFKGRPVTDDLRGTMAKPLLAELRRCFPQAGLRGWDAVVKPAVISATLGIDAKPDLAAAVAGANLVVIANNHPCFQEMLLDELAEGLARPALIYDLWNHFAARDLRLPRGVAYIALGDGQLPLWEDDLAVPSLEARTVAAW